MTRTTCEFDVEDVEYLRHGDQSLLARLFKPRGRGPFPSMVALHGGAWNAQDRTNSKSTYEALARTGVVVAALDYRHGLTGPYPASLQDINYAVRWVKARARDFNGASDAIGILGTSSGGHLAMLHAMRPEDPRYAAIPALTAWPRLDATVCCVAMFWPVINPAGRYRLARSKSGDEDTSWAGLVKSHLNYWKTEEAMQEGSPLVALQRGETVRLPPAMWIQPAIDPLHVYQDPGSDTPGTDTEKFATAYRKAGGELDLAYLDAPRHFTDEAPDSPTAKEAFERLGAFVHRHMPVMMGN